MSGARRVLLGTALTLVVAAPVLGRLIRDRFGHPQHRELFPSCLGCHAGAQEPSLPLWPTASDCAACHDGTIQANVEWAPPGRPHTTLRFSHREHMEAVAREARDSVLDCGACHTEPGGPRMQVRRAVVENCLTCHGIRTAHLASPDTACATCHVPLARAARLTREEVAEFPAPESHRARGFAFAGHGKLAQTGTTHAVAASCATCHARDFCVECHVNAPEVPAIQALAPDPRSLAFRPELKPPPSHAAPDLLSKHGAAARTSPKICAACHTQESCLTCHVGTPRVAAGLARSAPDRGRGAVVERRRPASHGADFTETHNAAAAATPASCASCHARTECLDCHRPDPAGAPSGYHPVGFLSTHPVAAYQRETSCADCHNTSQFCSTCHASAGLSTEGRLGAGYHDAKRFFLLGHGQAARQNLESCAACHAERDCLSCHSAAGGRRFNPHGPGFDANRLRRRNPQMCTACHGAAIPGGD